LEENESCAKIVYFNEGSTGETTETHHCINTNYCDKDMSKFGFGPIERTLSELSCPDPDGMKQSQQYKNVKARFNQKLDSAGL